MCVELKWNMYQRVPYCYLSAQAILTTRPAYNYLTGRREAEATKENYGVEEREDKNIGMTRAKETKKWCGRGSLVAYHRRTAWGIYGLEHLLFSEDTSVVYRVLMHVRVLMHFLEWRPFGCPPLAWGLG